MDVLLGLAPHPKVAAEGAKPLPEACRPRTSLGVLYSDTEVASLRSWLASGAPGPALATAGPGSGLTTLVQLLVDETGLESVWAGCGTPRIRALLEQAGGSAVSVTLKRKIIVVDEFDALAGGDTLAMSDVLSFARSKPRLPVLVLSHATRSSKTLEFAKTWPKFAFGRPGAGAVAAHLKRVAVKHGIRASDEDIDRLAREARGDVRAALIGLDLRRLGTGHEASGDVHSKDEAVEALDLTEAVLRGQRGHTVCDCLKLFGMESAVVPMGIYENYLTSLGKDDMRAVTEAAEAFSQANVVDRYLYSKQAWDLYDVYGVCAVAATSLALRQHRRGKPSQTFGVTKFGSVWSKAYNMCAKTKHAKALAFKYAEAGLQPLGTCDLAWVRRCLRSAVERAGDDEEIARVTWPLAAADVLCLARLDTTGSAWYKQAVHSRVKRVLAGR